jgi:hypothetical protein
VQTDVEGLEMTGTQLTSDKMEPTADQPLPSVEVEEVGEVGQAGEGEEEQAAAPLAQSDNAAQLEEEGEGEEGEGEGKLAATATEERPTEGPIMVDDAVQEDGNPDPQPAVQELEKQAAGEQEARLGDKGDKGEPEQPPEAAELDSDVFALLDESA